MLEMCWILLCIEKFYLRGCKSFLDVDHQQDSRFKEVYFLVGQMLIADPKERISMKDVLNHPGFTLLQNKAQMNDLLSEIKEALSSS